MVSLLTGRDQLLLTDITEHHMGEGRRYCCAIKDVYSNRIVGYSLSDRMTAKLAVDALRNAVTRRGDVAGCILYADRGSQFRSRVMGHDNLLQATVAASREIEPELRWRPTSGRRPRLVLDQPGRAALRRSNP